MTTEPRSSRAQRLRRLLLLPTGRRRKSRDRGTKPTRAVVMPPMPTTPPPVVSTPQAVDAVMRRLSSRTLAQVAAHEGVRVPVVAPAVAALGMLAPPAEVPAARPLPGPRRPVDPPTAEDETPSKPLLKITTLGSTPPSGTSVPTDPASIPTFPVLTPSEFLATRGWDGLFQVVDHDEVDTLSFTLRRGGAAVRVSDTTIEIPKIPVEQTQVPHLCKHCQELHSGLGLGGRMWRCDGCKMVAAY